MDRGAWRVTIHGVAESWTWLKQLSTRTQCIYVESRKMVLMNLLEGRNRDADVVKRLVDTAGEGEGGTNGESSIDICTPRCIKQAASRKLP